MIAAAALLVILAGGEDSGSDPDNGVREPRAGRGAAAGSGARVELRPENGSGVSGAISFGQGGGGIEVRLELRNLPDPKGAYVGAIYEGSCPEEQGSSRENRAVGGQPETVFVAGFAHGGEGAPGADEENVVQTLTLVTPEPDGSGSSITPLPGTVDQFLSGPPKYVDIHGDGSRTIACGDLPRREIT